MDPGGSRAAIQTVSLTLEGLNSVPRAFCSPKASNSAQKYIFALFSFFCRDLERWKIQVLRMPSTNSDFLLTTLGAVYGPRGFSGRYSKFSLTIEGLNSV